MRKNESAQDIARIAAAWLLFLVGLRVMQKMGYPLGFNVWPMGEDRNWLSWLQTGKGSEIARMFWGTNDRNPVSPWWYIAFKPLILWRENGLLFARYLMSLLCGASAYLLLRQLGPRTFALAVGILCAIFMANGYGDLIYWNFIGALSMSLLCVWAFTHYLRTGSVHWYGASVVLWFVALASYTLQIGAVLAVAYLSFVSAGPGLRARLVKALKDTIPFLGVFAVFMLIWRTASSPTMAQYYQTTFTLPGLLQSIAAGVWHPDFPVFLFWWAPRPLAHPMLVANMLALAVGVYLLMPKLPAEGARPARSTRDIIMVALCLVAPTVAVESVSVVWGPGTRWRMLHQLWVPLYVAGAAALVLWVVGRAFPARRAHLWALLVAACAFGLTAVSVGHNQDQVTATAAERAVRDAMTDVLAAEGPGTSGQVKHFIVVMGPAAGWISSDELSQKYADTWFPGRGVTLRTHSARDVGSPLWTAWPITFGPDAVKNVDLKGSSAAYGTVRVLAFDGQKIKSMAGAKHADFAGTSVMWQREAPLP
ncbi:hypothetical protein [Variovorax sp. RA8]|uniref:hypothetical protein n=1 Tax=Variovorax sp. (strain JCM 16519 / RA8) TaxID=662548 RepID=UPI0013167197|nr:hypothetical protein [Variovorax sp. RA8]VTU35510.1 hypothetical protein RA8CHR_05236 [Variovorax sp. RA8]